MVDLNCMFVLKESWGALTQSTLHNPWKKLLPNHQSNAQSRFWQRSLFRSYRYRMARRRRQEACFLSHGCQSPFKHLRSTGLVNWWRLSLKFKLQWHGRRRGSWDKSKCEPNERKNREYGTRFRRLDQGNQPIHRWRATSIFESSRYCPQRVAFSVIYF